MLKLVKWTLNVYWYSIRPPYKYLYEKNYPNNFQKKTTQRYIRLEKLNSIVRHSRALGNDYGMHIKFIANSV